MISCHFADVPLRSHSFSNAGVALGEVVDPGQQVPPRPPARESRPVSRLTCPPMTHLLLIGGGRMGAALLTGLLDARGRRPVTSRSWNPMTIVRPSCPDAIPASTSAGIPAPRTARSWPRSPTRHRGGPGHRSTRRSRVLSVAAGVRLAAIEAVVPGTSAVIRAMSNTPALVGFGATAIAAGFPRR